MEFNFEKDLLEEINEEEIEANLSGGTVFQHDTTGVSLCIRCIAPTAFTITFNCETIMPPTAKY